MQEREETASALQHVARRHEYSRAEEVQHAHLSITYTVLSITLNVLPTTKVQNQYITLKLLYLEQILANVYTQVAKDG